MMSFPGLIPVGGPLRVLVGETDPCSFQDYGTQWTNARPTSQDASNKETMNDIGNGEYFQNL
jgi:hypothetical protein